MNGDSHPSRICGRRCPVHRQHDAGGRSVVLARRLGAGVGAVRGDGDGGGIEAVGDGAIAHVERGRGRDDCRDSDADRKDDGIRRNLDRGRGRRRGGDGRQFGQAREAELLTVAEYLRTNIISARDEISI